MTGKNPTPSLEQIAHEAAVISNADTYFRDGCGRCPRFETDDCSARQWAAGLASLRALCLQAGLTEAAKWGHPCYMHANRNIAILGAFRGDLRITFFNAALLSDPQCLLTQQGPNTRQPDALRFTDNTEVIGLGPAILDFLKQSMAHAAAGTLPPKEMAPFDLPVELTDALEADPTLAAAFHALTPGRQKSHALAITAGKASATRHARVLKLAPLILMGKGAQER